LTAASAQPITTVKHALSVLSETTLALRSTNPPPSVGGAEKGRVSDKKAQHDPPEAGRDHAGGHGASVIPD
jgi:hypothetical protein